MTETNNINTVVAEILRGAKQVSGEVYAASKEALSASIDYIQKEMPELAEQYLKWEFASACVNATFLAIIIGIIIYIAFRLCKHIWKDNPSDQMMLFPVSMITIALLLPISMGFYDNFNKALKISVAPKIYLIESIGEKIGIIKK